MVFMSPAISDTPLPQRLLVKPSSIKGLVFPMSLSESFHVKKVKDVLEQTRPPMASTVGHAV